MIGYNSNNNKRADRKSPIQAVIPANKMVKSGGQDGSRLKMKQNLNLIYLVLAISALVALVAISVAQAEASKHTVKIA